MLNFIVMEGVINTKEKRGMFMSKKTKQSSTQSSTDRVATWVQITIAFITFSGLIFTIGAFVLNAIFTQISRLDERMQTLEGRIFDIAR